MFSSFGRRAYTAGRQQVPQRRIGQRASTSHAAAASSIATDAALFAYERSRSDAVRVRAVDEDVAARRQAGDVDRLALLLAARSRRRSRARCPRGAVRAPGRSRPQSPVQRGARFSGARLVRVVEAEAGLAIAPDERAVAAELVALERRRGASAGASASGRSEAASAARIAAPPTTCHARIDAADALALDDERRPARRCRPPSRTRAAACRAAATTETPNGAAWSRSGSGSGLPTARAGARRARSHRNERAIRTASARDSLPSSRSVSVAALPDQRVAGEVELDAAAAGRSRRCSRRSARAPGDPERVCAVQRGSCSTCVRGPTSFVKKVPRLCSDDELVRAVDERDLVAEQVHLARRCRAASTSARGSATRLRASCERRRGAEVERPARVHVRQRGRRTRSRALPRPSQRRISLRAGGTANATATATTTSASASTSRPGRGAARADACAHRGREVALGRQLDERREARGARARGSSCLLSRARRAAARARARAAT